MFGIGGESLAVAQNTYAVAWFKGKELNMVFGFQVIFNVTNAFFFKLHVLLVVVVVLTIVFSCIARDDNQL